MFDPKLATAIYTAISFGICGSLASVAVRFFHRKQEGPGLGSAAMIGFLVGIAWGAFFALFQSILS